MSMHATLFSSAQMQAIFSPRHAVQRMLDVEAALARVQGRMGLIPATAVPHITSCCEASAIDLQALEREAAAAGNLAIPLVRQLTAAVSTRNAEAGKFVHWGATSQDILDSALMLQMRDALPLLRADLQGLADALATLAAQHRATLMAGRTWMQHALPVTFGLKVAGWLDAMLRHQDRLDALDALLCLQFGGAAGTLASLGGQGGAVSQELARMLNLQAPDCPWHAQRDRVVEIATTLGLLVGALGKMARDISLLTQTEVAEVAEPVAPGRGASSAMPHKQNPVGCAVALAAAVRVPGLVSTMLSAMVQEHERALGGWQAEWETLPQIVLLCAGALQQMREVSAGLRVDTAKMRANLDLTHGQLMAEAVALALGTKLGRAVAHELVEQACRRVNASGQHLRVTLAEDPQIAAMLNAAELDRLLDPAHYTGQSEELVERILQSHQRRKSPNRQE
jgi:3-carboxy-cis,cis-muconate cycloisomerase